MKTRLLLPFTFLLLTSITFTACSNVDCDELETNFEALFADEYERINDALEVYINDPTDDNCDDVKDALNELIDEVEDYDTCADSRSEAREFREELDDLREELDDLCE